MKLIALVLLVVLFIAPGFSMPAAAQISTNTPSATVTPQATAAATEPAVVVAPTPVVSDVAPATSAPEGYISIWATVLIAVVASIVSGLATGASVARIVVTMLDKINNDPTAIGALETAIDRLGKSALTDDILRAVNVGAQIASKITDGIPESAKTPSANEGPLSDDMRERLSNWDRAYRGTAQGYVPTPPLDLTAQGYVPTPPLDLTAQGYVPTPPLDLTAQGYVPATGFEEGTVRADKEGRVTVEGFRALGGVPPSFLFEPKDMPPDDASTEPKQPETAEGGA